MKADKASCFDSKKEQMVLGMNRSSQRGQGVAEYLVIILLVVVLVLIGFKLFGNQVTTEGTDQPTEVKNVEN